MSKKPTANLDASHARPYDEARQSAAEWVPASTLKPWTKNPRKNDAAVPKVLASLKRFGWASPILARSEDREVVAGHTRLKAHEALTHEFKLAQLGGKRLKWHADALRSAETGEVPVRFGEWSAKEAHLLALADNRLNEIAEWDNAAVVDVLNEYGIGDVPASGFSVDDLAKMAGFGDSEEGQAAQVDTSDMSVSFSVTAHGPIAVQPAVLQALRSALAAIPDVQVEIVVDGEVMDGF